MGRRRERTPPAASGTVVLDAGGVSAAAAGSPLLRGYEDLGWTVATPAPVLAEALRGDPGADATANRALARTEIVICDEDLAREAAALRTPALRTATPSGTDAVVAAVAARRTAAVILTSDEADLDALTTNIDHVQVVST